MLPLTCPIDWRSTTCLSLLAWIRTLTWPDGFWLLAQEEVGDRLAEGRHVDVVDRGRDRYATGMKATTLTRRTRSQLAEAVALAGLDRRARFQCK